MRYFLRPTKLRWSRKESLAGKASRPRGWIYSQTRSTRSERPTRTIPCIWDQQRQPRTLRDHVQSASALSALKKSLVANLSAKRQLSVDKLSAKRNVPLAKRDFLVANGRMAADFSSPATRWPLCVTHGPFFCVKKRILRTYYINYSFSPCVMHNGDCDGSPERSGLVSCRHWMMPLL